MLDNADDASFLVESTALQLVEDSDVLVVHPMTEEHALELLK